MAIFPVPETGDQPCGWSINTACDPCWDGYTPDVQAMAATWAAQVLWALTGRRYGPCPVVVRPTNPCHARSYVTYPVYMDSPWGGGGGGWLPYIDDGNWYNCACPGTCCCDPGCRVALASPAHSVQEIRVNGVIIDPSTYRIVDGFWLVRSGTECWPRCQKLANPDDSSEDTFVVEYSRGDPLPATGQFVAGVLASALAKRCAAGNCAVPFNITSLTREGVTVEVGDVTTVGSTGIKVVDDWVNAVNPGGLISRPSVWNPDMPSPEMTTWSAA